MRPSKPLMAARLALSTALVMAATMMLNVYVPATRGYFNLGETMIYFTALMMGPLAAAFAGGVGSALADIALGYTIYAPATLLIKAAEGAAAGLLLERLGDRRGGALLALSAAVVSGYFLLLLLIGTTLFAGELEVSLGALLTAKGFAGPTLWLLLACAAVATPLYITFRHHEAEGLRILSLLAAGLVMVAGYYFYEQLILGYYALAEVPVNLGQAVLGVAVAIPLYRAVKKLAVAR